MKKGLNIPLVFNTGGYDSVKTLKLLDGIFDIYMPDFKFWDNEHARRFCNVDDYREAACEAITEMHTQVGDLVIESGIAVKGVLLRHLVMPEGVAGTGDVMNFIAGKISINTYVNIMNQYRPHFNANRANLIGRSITEAEFSQALLFAVRSGLTRICGVTI